MILQTSIADYKSALRLVFKNWISPRYPFGMQYSRNYLTIPVVLLALR